MILSCPLTWTRSVLWQHIVTCCACVQFTVYEGSAFIYSELLKHVSDSLWSETCWSTFKYFIILIVSTYYILCISWIIKCLIIIDAWCKHENVMSLSTQCCTQAQRVTQKFHITNKSKYGKQQCLICTRNTHVLNIHKRSWWHPKTGSRTNFGTLSGCQG